MEEAADCGGRVEQERARRIIKAVKAEEEAVEVERKIVEAEDD